MLYSDDRLLARTAADLGLTLATFWLVLAVTRRLHRYRQTMNAVLGTSVLLTPLLMLLIALQQPAEMYYPVKLVAWAASIGVIVWYTLIVGHILKSALEIGFVTSIAIAITTVLVGQRGARQAVSGGRLMHIHIIGICGTFMGGIAALARADGHRVTGSDANVYPPMSSAA